MQTSYFIELDERCRKALDQLDKVERNICLQKSSLLFKLISIQPAGLSSIANANFEGVHYKYIFEFHKSYLRLLNN